MLDCITKDISFSKISLKLWCIYLVQHMLLHQIKAQKFYTDTGLQRVLNSPVNGKIQELFKAVVCFSSTFQGKLNFQGLFKSILYIQVLFKPVRKMCLTSTSGAIFMRNKVKCKNKDHMSHIIFTLTLFKSSSHICLFNF